MMNFVSRVCTRRSVPVLCACIDSQTYIFSGIVDMRVADDGSVRVR